MVATDSQTGKVVLALARGPKTLTELAEAVATRETALQSERTLAIAINRAKSGIHYARRLGYKIYVDQDGLYKLRVPQR